MACRVGLGLYCVALTLSLLGMIVISAFFEDDDETPGG